MGLLSLLRKFFKSPHDVIEPSALRDNKPINAPTDKGYIKIYSNALAFSAVKPDGSIRTWGNPEFEALVHH
jgi:hypothetical protein